MASNMTKEMAEVIARNLPEATAGEMRLYIEQAELDKASLSQLAQEKEHDLTKIRSLIKERDVLEGVVQNLTREVTDYKQREGQFNEADRNVLIAYKDMQTAAAVKDAVMEVVALVFKNTTVKRRVLENGTEALVVPATPPSQYNSGGSGPYPVSQPTSNTRMEEITDE